MKKASEIADKGKARAKPEAEPAIKPKATPKAKMVTKAKQPAKKPRGRPTLYTEELAREILLRMAMNESLRSICEEPHMPHESTVRGWAVDDKNGFFTQYMRAFKLRAVSYAEEIVDISDDDARDWEPVRSEDGEIIGIKVDGEHVTRSRLKVDSRKWVLSKLFPREFGDKIDHNHGVQPDNPLAKLFEQVAGTPLRPAGDGDEPTE